MEKQKVDREKPPTGKSSNLVMSVVAALFGVQSEYNRQQDFNQHSPWPFIIAGVVGIAVFVGVLAAITLAVTATH